MMNLIFSIILIAILLCSFACSSSHYAIKEDKASEIEYIIPKDSLPAFPLHNLMDQSVKRLTITTENISYKIQRVYAISDTSILIQSIAGYELYNKRLQKFNEDYIMGNVKIQYYPKPDTIIIPINSIQTISYYAKAPINCNENMNDENNRQNFTVLYGVEIDCRRDEITLSGFMQWLINYYHPVININTTFNASKDNVWISSSAFYSLGYWFLGSIIAFGPEGRKKINSGYQIFIFSPLLLTNAEHHIYLINPLHSSSDNHFGLSIFAEFRTDIYDPGWIVYSPGYGIQLELLFNKNELKDSCNLIYLQVGLEYPYNFQLGDFQKSRLFAGLKFNF